MKCVKGKKNHNNHERWKRFRQHLNAFLVPAVGHPLSLSPLSLSVLFLPSLPLSFLIYVPRWSEHPHRRLIINGDTSASDAASSSSWASSAGTHTHIHTQQCCQCLPRLWHQSRSVGVESLKRDTSCRQFWLLLVPPLLRAFYTEKRNLGHLKVDVTSSVMCFVFVLHIEILLMIILELKNNLVIGRPTFAWFFFLQRFCFLLS